MNTYKFEDIYVGLECSFESQISKDMLEDFIKLSGDINPLHFDKAFAVGTGHPDRVIHGMLSSSLYSTLVGVHLPGKYCLLHGIDLTFLKPVYPGDMLKVFGAVKYINDAYKQVEIKAHISNSDGVKVSKAKIKVGLNNER